MMSSSGILTGSQTGRTSTHTPNEKSSTHALSGSYENVSDEIVNRHVRHLVCKPLTHRTCVRALLEGLHI